MDVVCVEAIRPQEDRPAAGDPVVPRKRRPSGPGASATFRIWSRIGPSTALKKARRVGSDGPHQVLGGLAAIAQGLIKRLLAEIVQGGQ